MSGINLTFEGKLSTGSINIYNNAKVESARGTPPGPQEFNIISIFNYYFDPNNLELIWGNKGAFLEGVTVNELLTSERFSNVSITITQKFTFTVRNGVQTFPEGVNEIFLLEPTTLGGGLLIPTPFQLKGRSSKTGPLGQTIYDNNPSFTYQQIIENTVTSQTTLGGIQTIAWIDNSLNANKSISDSTLEMQMNVTLEFFCEEDNLETGFCPQYCNLNLQTCFETYKKYCLIDKDSSNNLNMFSSPACQEYIPNYIQGTADNTDNSIIEIDNLLTPACTARYNDFDSLENCTTRNCKEICACHMDKTLYDTLRQSIIDKFPEFSFAAIVEQCLYPLCVDSKYTTKKIGKACMVPKCINIADITNNGKIEGGATIKQSCNQGPNGGNGDNGDKPEAVSWIDRHWVWIVIGVAILIVLIIIILVVIAGESNKKKPPQPRLI